MKTPSMRVLALASLSMVGACAGASAPDAPGKRVEIQVAPLTLPSVTDVCYGLTVYNGVPGDEGTDTVWTLGDICSGQYGNEGGGDITYIGTCDANGQNNYVELILEGVYTAGGQLSDQITAEGGDADFENPCPAGDPCYLDFPCQENADTLVPFSLTIMRDANQGFFDVAVNFEDIFCSAKFDSCYDVVTTTNQVKFGDFSYFVYRDLESSAVYVRYNGKGWGVYTPMEVGVRLLATIDGTENVRPKEVTVNEVVYIDTTVSTTTGNPMNLLFSEGGVREHTAVAAVACTAGADSNGTELLFTTPTVTCEQVDGPTVTFEIDLVGDGITDNQGGNHTVDDLEGDYTLRYALYFGNEDLACGEGGPGSCEKVYYNIALDIADLANQDLTDCAYSVGVTATETGSGTFVDGVLDDANAIYPGISFGGGKGIPIVDTAPLCTANPLNGDGSLVQTGYIKGDAINGGGTPYAASATSDGGAARAINQD